MSVSVTSARLERRGIGHLNLDSAAISLPERMVALHHAGRSAWDSARLAVSVSLPEDAVEGQDLNALSVWAVLSESATSTRVTVPLKAEPRQPLHRRGYVRLVRADHHRGAVLSVVVVATVDGVPGRIVAESEDTWTVDVTSREAIRGNEVAIEECDFAAGPDRLRPFRDVPWLVETSGSVPSVRMNTGIDGLAQVLRGHGTGPERVARELLTAQIVAEVWTASFHAAVGELDTDESGRPRWPEGWRGTVLRAMLADVLPDATPDDALAEVHSIRTGRTGWSELQPRIIYAAQRRAKVARSLGHAVRALDLANRSEP